MTDTEEQIEERQALYAECELKFAELYTQKQNKSFAMIMTLNHYISKMSATTVGVFKRDLKNACEHMIGAISVSAQFDRVDRSTLSLRALCRIYQIIAFKIDVLAKMEDVKTSIRMKGTQLA